MRFDHCPVRLNRLVHREVWILWEVSVRVYTSFKLRKMYMFMKSKLQLHTNWFKTRYSLLKVKMLSFIILCLQTLNIKAQLICCLQGKYQLLLLLHAQVGVFRVKWVYLYESLLLNPSLFQVKRIRLYSWCLKLQRSHH